MNMLFPSDRLLPMERPWLEAKMIYRKRLRWIAAIASIGVCIALLLVCAASTRNLSVQGKLRTLGFVVAWCGVMSFAVRYVHERQKRRLEYKLRYAQICEMRAHLEQTLREHHLALPDVKTNFTEAAKRKKGTARVFVRNDEVQVMVAEDEFVTQVVAAIESGGHIRGEKVVSIRSASVGGGLAYGS